MHHEIHRLDWLSNSLSTCLHPYQHDSLEYRPIYLDATHAVYLGGMGIDLGIYVGATH